MFIAALIRVGPLRTFLVCGLAAAHMAAFWGISLPRPVPKDTSRPFPCLSCPCGCHNAEECARSCCCTSAQERSAWFQAHGQPDLAAIAAGQRDRVPSPCCPSRRTETSNPPSSCCCRPPANTVTKNSTKQVGYSFLAAQRCHGTYFEWLSTLLAVPMESTGPQWHDAEIYGDVADHALWCGPQFATSPPTPPPRGMLPDIDSPS